MKTYFLINNRDYDLRIGEVFKDYPSNIFGKIEIYKSPSYFEYYFSQDYDVYMVENLDRNIEEYGLGIFGSNLLKIIKKVSIEELIQLDTDGTYCAGVIKHYKVDSEIKINALKKMIELSVDMNTFIDVSMFDNNILNIDFIIKHIEKELNNIFSKDELRIIYVNTKSKYLKELVKNRIYKLMNNDMDSVEEYISEYDPYDYF